jgi:hypothetical protein
MSTALEVEGSEETKEEQIKALQEKAAKAQWQPWL